MQNPIYLFIIDLPQGKEQLVQKARGTVQLQNSTTQNKSMTQYKQPNQTLKY